MPIVTRSEHIRKRRRAAARIVMDTLAQLIDVDSNFENVQQGERLSKFNKYASHPHYLGAYASKRDKKINTQVNLALRIVDPDSKNHRLLLNTIQRWIKSLRE